MKIQTIGDIDSAIGILLEWTKDNKPLVETLKNCKNSSIRWMTLEKTILDSMPINEVDIYNWDPNNVAFRLRDRFFYNIQQITKLDFGFCRHFLPGWRNQADYFLSGSKTDPEKNWSLCTQGEITIPTICIGTERDRCVYLPDNEKEKIALDHEYNQIFEAVNESFRNALGKEYSKN